MQTSLKAALRLFFCGTLIGTLFYFGPPLSFTGAKTTFRERNHWRDKSQTRKILLGACILPPWKPLVPIIPTFGCLVLLFLQDSWFWGKRCIALRSLAFTKQIVTWTMVELPYWSIFESWLAVGVLVKSTQMSVCGQYEHPRTAMV